MIAEQKQAAKDHRLELTDEQIDELAAHEVPTPVIAPDPVELKIPDTADSESPADELPIEDSSIADEDTSEEEIDELVFEPEYLNKRKGNHRNLTYVRVCAPGGLLAKADLLGASLIFRDYHIKLRLS